MGIFDLLFKYGAKSTREEARRLGISVSEVEREIPQFSRDMASLNLLSETVVRYSVPRRGSTINSWQLLQRLPSSGANMPNNYLLDSSGSLPDALLDELRRIAEEYDEEFFEFEGTSSDVAVFWEEWGGPEKARSIHAQLDRLSGL